MNKNFTISFFFPGLHILLLSLLCIALTGNNTFAQVTPADYVTTWQTDPDGLGSNQITIPARGEYTVYYESIPAGISGTFPEVGTFTDFQTITFPAAGTYRVAIKPTGSVPFHQIDFFSGGDYDKLLTIEQWGTTVWSSMYYAYNFCSALTTLPEVDMPVLSGLTNMNGTFLSCTSLTGSSNMNNWDVSSVTNMDGLFEKASSFNQPLGNWNVGNVTIMWFMFFDATAFNQPIESWNVSNVTNMRSMFDGASSFNQPLGSWTVGNVTDMEEMFGNAIAFNQPINSWNVSNVFNMRSMFAGAVNFNQPLSSWNVGNITIMRNMFERAARFNQPLNTWNISNATRMQNMFDGATAFNQPLNNWTFNPDVNLSNMLSNSGMNCYNYNTTLIGWAANPATPDGRNIGVSAMTYGPPATAAHDYLINTKGWTFSGDSYDAACISPISPADYVTTWNTDARGFGSNQISIPAYGEYTVYYESIPAGISGTLPETGTFTDNQTITFPTAGTYRVAIKPTGSIPFHRMDFYNYGDSYQFLTIEQWGTTVWSSMEYAYTGCIALTTLPEIDVPVLSSVTSMGGAFHVCPSFVGSSNMNSWDVSSVTDMQEMFRDNEQFNQPLGDWNVSNVTTMQNMFWAAGAFNQPIDSWNVSNVTSMQRMFLEADSFNQPLGNWNTGNVTSMREMFTNTNAFNQPLNNWNVSNVTDFQNTFSDATAFNQPLSKWTFNPNANMAGMLFNSGIDCGNYNSTLIGWAANPATPDGINIGVVAMNYGPPASASHDDLINNKGWTFYGDNFDASCTSLPVTLISFEATKQEASVILTWSTTEETNSERFEIQRSVDAKNWKTIGAVASAGESKVIQKYHFNDRAPLNGVNYYRLKMVDRDKTFANSRIESVEFSATPALSVYPNPANDRILVGNHQQVKQITLFNAAGMKLLENKKVTAQGIDISKLVPGLHTIKMVDTDGNSQTTKLVIFR